MVQRFDTEVWDSGGTSDRYGDWDWDWDSGDPSDRYED